MNALEISGLTCGYTGNQSTGENITRVLSNLDFSIDDGEIVCLLGRSGCGKTTLLKAVSGLAQPIEGTISLHGQQVSSSSGMLPPEERGIGMIIQDYALFPHLTVQDNISFGLSNLTASESQYRVQEMLELVNLQGLHKRYPHELSGGQQQRVAIARALANKPSLLLLDEPFSNIDSQVRQHLVREIRDILKQQQVAGLFVTHSREEGFAFADTVAVLDGGKIAQKGSAFDVYHKPDNRFIADFMGTGNSLPATIIDQKQLHTPIGVVQSTRVLPGKTGDKAEIFIRPQMLTITPSSRHQGKIVRQQFMGRTIRSEIHFQDFQLIAEHGNPVPEGSMVQIQVQPHDLVLFDSLGQALWYMN